MVMVAPTGTARYAGARVPRREDARLVTGQGEGVGEGGAIGAPPPVVNAVADALAPFGVTITRQPLDPARVVALIEEASR